MSIIISIPKVAYNEIKYSVHCLFNVFLGVPTELYLYDGKDFKVSCPNGSFVIENHFFIEDDILDLYCLENIPKKVDRGNIKINKKSLPVSSIFGKPQLLTNQENTILCCDIISSTFFMLSRWEEYVHTYKDKHSRFPGQLSLAFKNGFLDKPVVNEYVDILWELLLLHGYKGIKKKRKFSITPTHDVDIPYKWNSFISKGLTFLSSIFRFRIISAFHVFRHMVNSSDMYNTFELLMDLAEESGVKAHFFFMTGGDSKNDNMYSVFDKKVIKLIKSLISRNHYIGLHPSYNSYADKVMFSNEKKLLEKVSGLNIISGRQHVLRFDVPITWSIWEENNMEWDSTMTYADNCGFRCGVCYPFPVYDILKRKQLLLLERPLIVMDVTLAVYENLEAEIAIDKVKQLKETVKKYNGEFVFLWHNSSFNYGIWNLYKQVLIEMYKK